jgi:UDP-2,4-diacetamido-2,4,6-trideoxy-beta-L-altropyranose hydrolase
MAMSPAEPKASEARILFLADCGPEVGGGHVMRCLALAQALTQQGAACAMLEPQAAAGVLDAFAPPELERIRTAASSRAGIVEAAVQAAEGWRAGLVFVDHYGLGKAEELRLGEGDRAVAVIDDLADRAHACRLLVDPSLGRTSDDYRNLTPADCQVLAGPDFALLAPAFGEARAAALAARRPEAKPRRLLVSLGLMDLRGITCRVLELIQPKLGDMQVDVVAGAAAPSLPALRAMADDKRRIRLHVDTRNMADLIACADIGIGAGGVSTWERAALGLPSISLILADNQRPLALELDRQGAVLAVEAWSEGFASGMDAAFERISSDGSLRARLSETSAALCDGDGAKRVAAALLRLLA